MAASRLCALALAARASRFQRLLRRSSTLTVGARNRRGGADATKIVWILGRRQTVQRVVWVPAGQHVLLDVSPGRLYLLLLTGTLDFDRVEGLHLEATYILVKGPKGHLKIGTANKPFQQRATITLYGHVKSLEIPVFGAKVLANYRGTVDIHGEHRACTWTRLATTAKLGSNLLRVQKACGFKRGDYVSVASTDWTPKGARDPETIVDWSNPARHTEALAIANVSTDGTVLTLERPLLHTHLGESFYVPGDARVGSGVPRAVEMRAEVGLLSRNVVIQGNGDSNRCVATPRAPGSYSCARFGGVLMTHSPGHESAIVRLDGVELRNMGQGYRIGRYPINFHWIGRVRRSFVRQCSVHHSFNRGIGMNGVMVFVSSTMCCSTSSDMRSLSKMASNSTMSFAATWF